MIEIEESKVQKPSKKQKNTSKKAKNLELSLKKKASLISDDIKTEETGIDFYDSDATKIVGQTNLAMLLRNSLTTSLSIKKLFLGLIYIGKPYEEREEGEFVTHKVDMKLENTIETIKEEVKIIQEQQQHETIKKEEFSPFTSNNGINLNNL